MGEVLVWAQTTSGAYLLGLLSGIGLGAGCALAYIIHGHTDG